MRSVLLTLAVTALARGSTIYNIVDLGPFNGQAPISNSNASGAIASGNGHAIVTVGATTIDLGVLPGGSWSAAYGINDAGDVTGYGDTGNGHFHAFIWTPATGMTMLGTLGGLDSYGMGINDSGVIVGHSSTANGYIHAFVSSSGALVDLGTLGGTSSYAYGINDAGAVVGYSVMADGSLHAFRYDNGVMIDLNGLIGGGSGWALNGAYAIDAAGKIVGVGTYGGAQHEFLLEPVSAPESTGGSGAASTIPEPATWLLAFCGTGLLTCVARLRRKAG